MAGSIGTGLANPPVTMINTLNAITQKYIIPVLGDNVFTPSPAFGALTKDGKKFSGGELVYPLVTQEEMTGGAYQGDQLLDTAVIDSIQPANQVWRFYRQSLAIPITDIILNRGMGQNGGVDLITSKYKVASASMLQKLQRALWDVSPQNTAIDIDSLPDWVKSTTNTIAGINRNVAAGAFWKPAANVGLGGAATPQLFEDGYGTVTWGFDEPDLLLMAQVVYTKFKQQYMPVVGANATPGVARWNDNAQDRSALQSSFKVGFWFNNAAVVQDRVVPAGEAYLLNSKYLFPVFHEADYFTVDPFIKPSNQRVLVSTMYLTWQAVCQSPRMNVAYTGGPT